MPHHCGPLCHCYWERHWINNTHKQHWKNAVRWNGKTNIGKPLLRRKKEFSMRLSCVGPQGEGASQIRQKVAVMHRSKDQSKHTGILLWQEEVIIPFPVFHPTQGGPCHYLSIVLLPIVKKIIITLGILHSLPCDSSLTKRCRLCRVSLERANKWAGRRRNLLGGKKDKKC